MFKFIHAADIHLDSPLRGLERYDGAPVDEIRQATRRALENFVRLAIDEAAAFVLIAGDLYDGDWLDHRTGLFFVAEMAKLREAGIQVFLIAGNHDAANKMTKTLAMPANVRMLSHKRPETVWLDECGVAIHGQSFATAAVSDDLSLGYPAAEPGLLNVGLLHTSATGREGHEPYAPCTLDGLRSKGYDYWALGHVHKAEVLCQDPLIIFPGNIQGRHIRETGAKGCTLVTVDHSRRLQIESRLLEVLRWELCRLDASGAETPYDVLDRFRVQLGELVRGANGLPLAVRVEVAGACPAHARLAATPQRWVNEIRAAAIDIGGGNVWIEKVRLGTALSVDLDQAQTTDGPVGELIRLIGELKADPNAVRGLLREELETLTKKLPAELIEGPDALDLQRPETLCEALDQAQQMLVQRLLGREEAL